MLKDSKDTLTDMHKLTAVITAYNRADFVDKCLTSVLAAADDSLSIHVIVMDNGSTDETPEVVRSVMASHPDGAVRLERTEDNRPVIGVINLGLRFALEDPATDYVLYLNEDTEFTPGSLLRLVDACEANRHALLTPLQLNYRAPEHLDDGAFGHLSQARPLIEDLLLDRPKKAVYSVPTMVGASMMASAETWRNLGAFDPLFWFYGVDDDLCKRAHWLGYGVLLVPDAHLFHAHGKLGVEPSELPKAARNRKWRNELQARYIFLLKDPEYSLARGCFECLSYALRITLHNLRILWLGGVVQAPYVCAQCLAKLPDIAKTRRRHFDPAKKIGPAQRNP